MTTTLADELVSDFGQDDKQDTDNEMLDDLAENENLPFQDDMEVDSSSHSSSKWNSNAITDGTLNVFLEKIQKQMSAAPIPRRKTEGAVDEHPEYKLVVEANQMTAIISSEISRIYKLIRDTYSKQFPDMESLIMNPIDYAKVVQQIGSSPLHDLARVNLSAILPAHTIMILTVAGTTTSGKPLHPEELKQVLDHCKLLLELDEAKKKIVEFVSSRMTFIAPNLSIMVGSTLAAKMISFAGGITSLAKTPPCNIPALGATKKALAGFSSSTVKQHAGIVWECDIIKKTPSMYQTKAVRVLSARLILAVRVDAFSQDPSGITGSRFREEVQKKIEKWQEAPPMKEPKPLKAPTENKKPHRGGRKLKNLKKRFQMTELRKAENRMAFGAEGQETYRNMERDLGMIGGSGLGKVRLAAQDKGILKKTKPQQQNSSVIVNGLTTSLAFTPVQGIELGNPMAQNTEPKRSKYFG